MEGKTHTIPRYYPPCCFSTPAEACTATDTRLVKLFDLRSGPALNVSRALIHDALPMSTLHPGLNSEVDVCAELEYSATVGLV